MRAAHAQARLFASSTPKSSRTVAAEAVEQELLAAERHAGAARGVHFVCPREGQRLIAMLIADPPVAYAEMSARLGIPIGSIGPTAAATWHRMRRHPTVAALINAESGPVGRSWLRPAEPPATALSADVHHSGNPYRSRNTSHEDDLADSAYRSR